MSSQYPDIGDKNFYGQITKKYIDYKITKHEKSYDAICFPRKW